MDNKEKKKWELPQGKSLITLIVLITLGLVGGYFLFGFTSDFVAKATIFNPGGAPLLNEPTADPNAAIEPGSTPTPTSPPLDTFTMPEAWDGKPASTSW